MSQVTGTLQSSTEPVLGKYDNVVFEQNSFYAIRTTKADYARCRAVLNGDNFVDVAYVDGRGKYKVDRIKKYYIVKANVYQN